MPFSTYLFSVLFFAGLFAFLLIPCHIISSKFPVYQNSKNRVAWLSYCLSQIHAPISGLLSLYCYVTFDPGSKMDYFTNTNDLSIFTLVFTLGFMLTDFCLMMSAPEEFRDLYALVIHHLTILIIYSAGILTVPSTGCYFMLAFQIQELTNPFLTNRWFLLELGMKQSSAYLINGFIVLILFFFVRIVFATYTCFQLRWLIPPSLLIEYPQLQIAFYGAYFFQCFQFYWFFYILRALFVFLIKDKVT